MNQPPPNPPPPINLRRALVALLSTGVFVATMLGYIAQHTGAPREPIPMDPGTPVTVTTIGGPR